jgi:succinoglycan biosynthesis transport protein ExoP
VELRDYLTLLWKWAWLILLCALLAAVPAYLLTKRQPLLYQATTTLLISQASSASTQDYTSLLVGERLAETYAQLMTKQPVMDEVATRLNLGSAGVTSGVAVSPVEGTQLLTLRVVDTDPARARDVANTIPAVFAEQNEAMQLTRYSSSKANLLKEMEAVEADIEATQASLNMLRALPTPDAAEIGRLESALLQYRTTSANLLRSYEDIRVAEARAIDTVTIAEPAVVRVVGRKTLSNTVLAAIVGLMVAAGLAFLIEYLDDTIKSPQDVERAAGLPTFGSIIRFPHSNGLGPLTALEPRSAVAEGYRVLRTNMQFATMGMGKSAVVLLVSSAQPTEGKTSSVANLGASLAQAGRRVLLVDADLRRPALHRLFNLSKDVGLTSLLLEREADVEYVVQKTGIEGLRVLPSGPVPANPAEVLGFAEMGPLLERLRTMADYVLVDCPPVLSAADTSVLAQKVDGVLLVVEAGRTRTQMFERAVAALQGVKAHVLGTILTKVGVRRGASSYDYYYYYSNYYTDDENGRRKKRRHHRGVSGRLRSALGGLLGRRGRVQALEGVVPQQFARGDILPRDAGTPPGASPPAPAPHVGEAGEMGNGCGEMPT